MFALTVLTGLATFSQTEELTKTYFAEGEKKRALSRADRVLVVLLVKIILLTWKLYTQKLGRIT